VDLGTLTAVLVRLFLVVTMLSIGLRLGDAGSMVGGRIAPLLRLGVLNLVVVPLVAIVVCRALSLDGAIAFALLAMAVAPAGSLGPKLVQVARGDLALAVLATFVLSAIATLSVAPMLAVASEAVGIPADVAPVDARVVVANLAVFQLAPLVLGIAIAGRGSPAGARASEPLTRASSALLVAIVVVVLVDGWVEVTALGPAAFAAILLLIAATDISGWLAGGASSEARRAGALVTGQRSGALALLVVSGPDGAMASATVVAFSLLLLVVNLLVATALGRTSDQPVRDRAVVL
jgi:bile acid:Na+ symporter, BASS family